MEIISTVEPFDRVITFLDLKSPRFQLLTARRFTEFDTSYILFLLVFIVRYDLRF